MAKRLHAMGQAGYTDLPWTAQHAEANVQCHEDRLDLPLKWKKPRKIFVNSMSDLFHERVPFTFIKAVFNRMWQANHHTYQVLTKRPARMLEWWQWFVAQGLAESFMPRIPSHIWMCVSVEDQKTADERIPYLLQLPAAVRGLSCEPLLGPVRLDQVENRLNDGEGQAWLDALGGRVWERDSGGEHFDITSARGQIDWVIVGGESGPKARPMHPDWARSLRDQCEAAGVPFFFKQWGEWAPESVSTRGEKQTYQHGRTFVLKGKKRAGRDLDGREWNEMPMSEVVHG